MPILTEQEACEALNYTEIAEMPPKVLSILLPGVEEFLTSSTGKDWGTLTDSYTAIDPVAKMAAGILLVRWFEDNNEVGTASGIGVIGLIGQLEAKHLQELQKTTAE